MDTKKMRACAPLLPPPGAEVVVQCLDEIERLRADVLRLGALAQEARLIAVHGALPDGDEVNVSTLLWAEDWTRKLANWLP